MSNNTLPPQEPRPAPYVEPEPPEPPKPPVAPQEPRESVFERQRRQSIMTARDVMMAASYADTAREAEATKAAKALNIPREMLPDNSDVVTKMLREQQIKEFKFEQFTPATFEMLKDVKRARMWVDDLGNLQQYAGLFGSISRYLETGQSTNTLGFLLGEQAWARMHGARLTDQQEDRITELKEIQAGADLEHAGLIDSLANTIGQLVEPTITSIAAGGALAATTSLGGPISAGAAFTTGALTTTFAYSSLVEFGHEYDKIYAQLTEAGVSADEAHDTALKMAGGYAVFAGLVEAGSFGLVGKPFVGAARSFSKRLIGLSRPTTGRAGRRFVKDTILGLLSEPSEEFVQTLGSGAAENIAASFNKKSEGTGPSLEDVLAEAGSAALQAAKGMALLAPIGPSLHFTADMNRASMARRSAELAEGLVEAVKKSKNLTRSPETLAQAVQAAAPPSADAWYIEGPKLAQALVKSGQTREQLADKLPDVAKQLVVAEHTGDDVVIPMGDFAAHIADTDLFPAIKNSIRLKNGWSLDRAEEWFSEKEQNKKVMADLVAEASSKVADWDQQATAVEQRIAGELKATSLYSNEQVGYFAMLERQHTEIAAAKEGLTPAEWDAKHGVKFAVQKPEGETLEQFAGPKSQTANLFDFAKAKKMLAAGEDENKIRTETGWFIGPDNKWRYEISDQNAKFVEPSIERVRQVKKERGSSTFDLGEILQHPQLFAAYPQLATVPVRLYNNPGTGIGGYSSNLEIGVNVAESQSIINTLLHEIQHTLQDIEGFAKGGNIGKFTPEFLKQLGQKDFARMLAEMQQEKPEAVEFFDRLIQFREMFESAMEKGERAVEAQQTFTNAFNEAPPEVQQLYMAKRSTPRAYEAYLRLAGEVEARNTEERRVKSIQERELPENAPERTADVPRAKLIFDFDLPVQPTPPFKETLKQQLSTRLPTGKKSTEDPNTMVLSTDLEPLLDDKAALAKDVATIRTLPFLRIPKGASDKVVIEAYIKHVANNLDWLLNQMSPEERARARQWYEGGRKAVEHWADRYGISAMQAAGVIAVLSPQRDWFVNMTMAERMLDIVFAMKDHRWDDAMTKRANARIGAIPRPGEWKAKQLREAVAGKTLAEVLHDPELAAYWIRVFDQTHNDRKLAQWTPEGGTFGTYFTRIQWSSYPALVKVVSILEDGSSANVSQQLGNEHKVRSFYNNLFAPDSDRGHLTLDTHAVAAGYLLPLSGQSDTVGQVWGGLGGATSRKTGLNGFYPIMAEAYKRVAKAHKLLPREVQSITWEQVRLLFTPPKKRNEALLAQADAIWARHSKGEITQQAAQQEILKAFGGFGTLPWTKAPTTAEIGNTYEGLSRETMGKRKDIGRKTGPVKVMVEAKPDANPALMVEWNKLSPEAQVRATQKILNDVVPAVLSKHRANGAVVALRGAWEGLPAPSIAVVIEDADKASRVADELGDILFQNGMFVMSLAPGKDLFAGEAVRIDLPDGFTVEQIDKLYTDVFWPILDKEGKRAAIGHSTQEGVFVVGMGPHTSMTAAELLQQVMPKLDDTFGGQVVDLHMAFRNAGEHYETIATGPSVAAEPSAQPRGRSDLAPLAERAYREAFEAERRRGEPGGGGGGSQAVAFQQPGEAGIARGEFEPLTRTIWLNPDPVEGANATTVLHELSHFWLTSLFRAASTPTASEQMKKDAQTVLDWFGVKDLETWNSMSLAEQRPHQESWAVNSEAHFFGEGKSPGVNEEQRRMFRTFGRWVRAVYRQVRDVLNANYRALFGKDLPGLTPEVRDVFDRMLASEDAIEAAKVERAMAPMLREKPADMTDEDWAEYVLHTLDGSAQATEELQRASLQAMKWAQDNSATLAKKIQRHTRQLRAKVEAEERKKVEAEPIYYAEQMLRHGKVDDEGRTQSFKLSLDQFRNLSWIGDRTAEELEQKLGVGASGMLAKDGLPIDIAAQMLGFPSGETLVKQLAVAPPMEQVVQQRTNARMAAEHSDFTDPAKVKLLIEKALHNGARTRMVAAELRWLKKITTPVQMMIRAARDFARDTIGRQKIGLVRPHEHAQAEVRERREAERSLIKGDHALAAAHKRRELVEGQLEREAIEVRETIEKTRELVKKLFKSDKKLATKRNVDYIAVARYLAAAFTLAPGDRNAGDYIKQLQQYNPGMAEKLAPQIELAQQWAANALADGRVVQSWRDLTVDEFRDLHDSLLALWNTSAREEKFAAERSVQQLDDVAAEVVAEHLKTAPATPEPVGAIGRGWNSLKQLVYRPEHWAYRRDGAKVGAFTRYFWRPIRNAVDRYVTKRNEITKRIADRVEKLRPSMKLGQIEFRDRTGKLLHVFGKDNGGFGEAELAAALLHTGNESNMRKLLVGRGWGNYDDESGVLDTREWDAFVKRMIDQKHITKETYEFVQWVWDLNENVKQLAQEAHHDLFGYYFKEIEPLEITNEFGTFRGGYMPATLDQSAASANRIQSLADLEKDFRKQFAATGKGFTMERSENFAEPLMLNLDMIPSHIDDVLRFSMLQPAIRDVERLAQHRDVAAALEAAQPGVWNNMLLPWLQRVASQSITKAGKNKEVDAFWRYVRSSSGLAVMAANIPNALQQLTGAFVAAVRVGPRYLFRGMWRLLTERGGLFRDIASESPFMADRQKSQVFDSLERINELTTQKSKFAKLRGWVRQHGYFMQSTLQNLVDSVTWSGAYEQSLEKAKVTMSDEDAKREAVTQADAAVRMTQSSFTPTDVAQYEEGTPFYRLFTMFSGYFNSLANLQADELVRLGRATGIGKAGVAANMYLLGFLAPALLAEAITRTLRGRWDDEDDDGDTDVFTLDYLFLTQLRSAVAEVPVAGPNVLAPMLNAFDNKPYNDRMTTSPAVKLFEDAFGGTVRAGKRIAGLQVDRKGRVKGPDGEDIRDVLTLLGIAFGVPAGIIGSRAGYAVDVAQGTLEPGGMADYLRGLISGTAGTQATRRAQ